MLIAISANNSDLESQLEPRFGRAGGFVIYDTDTKQSRFISNEANSQLSQGAGIQTAQMLADQGVKSIISGTFGPKAVDALNRGGIEMVSFGGGTVGQAIDNFVSGGSARNATAPNSTMQQTGAAGGCRRMGGTGMGRGMGGGGRGMAGGGRGMGGGGRGMGGGGRGMGGGGRGMGGGGQ